MCNIACTGQAFPVHDQATVDGFATWSSLAMSWSCQTLESILQRCWDVTPIKHNQWYIRQSPDEWTVFHSSTERTTVAYTYLFKDWLMSRRLHRCFALGKANLAFETPSSLKVLTYDWHFSFRVFRQCQMATKIRQRPCKISVCVIKLVAGEIKESSKIY